MTGAATVSKTRMTRTRSKSMIFRVVALLIIFLAATFHSLSDTVSPAESIADGMRCSCNLTGVRLQGSLIIQLSRNFNGTGSLGSKLCFFFLSERGFRLEKWETTVSLPPLQCPRGLATQFRASSATLLGQKRPPATQARCFRARLPG